MGEVVQVQSLVESKKVNNAIQEQINKKSEMYASDFKRFKQYADSINLSISFSALESYLLHTVEVGLKLSTFNRRCAAVKHFLISEYKLHESDEQKQRIALLRQKFNDERYSKQKKMKGQTAQPKHEVLGLIEKLDTRAKAISLFNLITACRPSEMISIQVKDIDLINRTVDVYMQKQKDYHTKGLTLECINAIRNYIKEYGLNEESYLVGKVDKHNNYTSVKVSDVAYRKAIHKWLRFAPYTLRKTQVTAMHKAGADIATIAEQTGHKNLETISKHYLKVDKSTVDKYL